jgi:predicted nucleic acid-binding protein
VSRVVVDTSLAIKWVKEEEGSLEAWTQRRLWNGDGTRVHVPNWFSCEFTNVLFQAVRSQRLTLHEAVSSIGSIASYVSVLEADLDLAPRVLRIALETGQKASYDSYYVALAEHHECELWTADARFWRAVNSAFPFVKWLGNVITVAEPKAQ